MRLGLRYDISTLEKARKKAVGERSTYRDGSVWQKQPNGKWKCIKQAPGNRNVISRYNKEYKTFGFSSKKLTKDEYVKLASKTDYAKTDKNIDLSKLPKSADDYLAYMFDDWNANPVKSSLLGNARIRFDGDSRKHFFKGKNGKRSKEEIELRAKCLPYIRDILERTGIKADYSINDKTLIAYKVMGKAKIDNEDIAIKVILTKKKGDKYYYLSVNNLGKIKNTAISSYMGESDANSSSAVSNTIITQKETLSNTNNSSNAKLDKEYFDAINKGDMAKVREMVMQKAKENGFNNAIPEQAEGYSLRVKRPPQKTKTVYKTFYVDTKGKPSALFIGNNENIPMNVWVDAKDAYHFTDPTNGRVYVPSLANPTNKKAGKTGDMRHFDEETKKELVKRGFITDKANSITALAYRPGWHAGDLPFFPQGGTKLKGQKTNYDNIHRWNQVVFENVIKF